MHILDIEKTIVTKQQETGFKEYRKALEEGCPLTFKEFYWFWQFENGLFDDSNLLN